MGTRQGGGIGSSPPRAGVPQEYEEFTPTSEWREAEQSHLLTVNVPDFAKEQLKVSTEGTNTLRIRGERQIGVSGNKRSRFQKDFRIPEGCNVRGIRAKLAEGILTITFPYETTQLPPPPPPPTELESKTTTQQPPQPPPKELEAKTATQQTPQPPPVPPPPPPSPKDLEAKKTTQQSPPPPPRRSQKDIQDQQSAVKTLIPQMRQPSNTLPPPTEDQIIPTTTIATPKRTSISSRDGQKQPDESIENERRGDESADDQRQKGDESLTRDELESVGKGIVKKEEERGGTATATSGGEEADREWFKIEKYIEVLAAVKRLAQTNLDHDDRELLAKMGVAALIILAFGVYIYYKLNSTLNSSEES